MLERIKTAVLATLVILSLFLTGQHWTASFASIASPRPGFDQYEPQTLDVLAPSALYVHGPEGSRLFSPGQDAYANSWALFRQLTGGFHVMSTRQGSALEWESLLGRGALEFRLAGRVQLRMWLESLGRPQGLSTEHFFSHLLLSPDAPHVYFRDTQTGTYLVWEGVVPQEALAEVFESVSKLEGQAVRRLEEPYLSKAESWVYVPENPGFWRELYVRNETTRMIAIVNSFFSDLSLVRRVGERDGRTNFTDGRRVAWADAYGGVEYFNPSYPTKTQHGQATADILLQRGISFVSKSGGWPAELERRLKNMDVIAGPEISDVPYIDFEFVTFYRDATNPDAHLIPLVSWRKEIGLRVTERDVLSYKRFVYVPDRLGPWLYRIIPAEVALKALTAELMDKQVTKMYLAYYQREILSEEYLYPVWVVEQGSNRLMVNAFTADVVKGP